MSCIFCDIINKTSPASIIYEDDVCMAFLDIFPVGKGHSVLIPKKHCENLQDCEPAVAQHLIAVTQKVNAALMKATGCGGVINEIRNGLEADQEILHFNINIVPRRLNDGFGWFFPPGYKEKEEPRAALDEIAAAAKKELT